MPSVQLNSEAVVVQLPPSGCNVTVRNVTPPGAASVRTTLCAWFGPLLAHLDRVGDVRLPVDELHLRRRVLDDLHVHELVRLHRRRRRRRRRATTVGGCCRERVREHRRGFAERVTRDRNGRERVLHAGNERGIGKHVVERTQADASDERLHELRRRPRGAGRLW